MQNYFYILFIYGKQVSDKSGFRGFVEIDIPNFCGKTKAVLLYF